MSDNVARLNATRASARYAVVLGLAELYAFWVGAHAFNGPMGVFFWVLFVLSALGLVVVVGTEVFAGAMAKVIASQEK
jgi:hypothetical protein